MPGNRDHCTIMYQDHNLLQAISLLFPGQQITNAAFVNIFNVQEAETYEAILSVT